MKLHDSSKQGLSNPIPNATLQRRTQRNFALLNRIAVMLAITFALTAPNVNAAADKSEPQSNTAAGTDLKARSSTSKFLEPLKLKFILSPDDPRRPQFCTRLDGHAKCPPIVSIGGSAGGGIPTIEPAFKANLPHVRVSFFIQEITNEAIENGGVETELDDDGGDFETVTWTTTGAEADVENGGPHTWILPGPAQTLNYSPGGLFIYDALVFNACGSFSSFPVEHESTLEQDFGTIGSFLGTDNSTIDSTGFYNLNYTVRAEDSDGGVSDFHFSGKASATCSGLNAL